MHRGRRVAPRRHRRVPPRTPRGPLMSPKGSRDLVPERFRITKVAERDAEVNPHPDGEFVSFEAYAEVERQREEAEELAVRRYEDRKLAMNDANREQDRAERAEAALAEREQQVRELIQKWERSGERIERDEGGETRVSRLF